MRILFLDIDGVLKDSVFYRIHNGDEFGPLFYPHLVDNLKFIIESTGAKIVISSTWRTEKGLAVIQEMWKKRNLPGEIIDATPDCSQLVRYGKFEYYDAVERGHEIQDWLDNHPEVINYVIIDDMNDMLTSQKENFVLCCGNKNHEDSIDSGRGLTKKCAELAIQILAKQIK